MTSRSPEDGAWPERRRRSSRSGSDKRSVRASAHDTLSAALAEVRASGVTTVPLFRFDDGTVLEGEPAEAEFTSALTR
ncbi:hypothetical protein SAXI111661_18010 [Saccharomonospora xinjiangensis]|uniref:hypothetical protein n=1 Tax=Saccharomonospora xinjiangensis TaxID=75294 RepID=UPI0010C546BF|nr:hypothetical protein [Saccharomonospora xinjiangensis]QBQ60298.1 hypothetical protein EYD13_09710 [Saccharomonospora xinjiangensis]